MKKRIKINGVLTAVAVIICLVFFKFLLPSWRDTFLNKSLATIAFLFFLTGLTLRIFGRAYKIEFSSQGESLVASGPYTMVRNPMYLGSFLIGSSFTLLVGNPWIIAAFIVIFFIRFLPQVRLEEKHLLNKFGKAYEDYLAAVPRFIPKKIIGIFKNRLHITHFPWIKKEIWAAIGWFLLFLLIALLKDLMIYDSGEFIKEITIFACIAAVFLVFLNNLTK